MEKALKSHLNEEQTAALTKLHILLFFCNGLPLKLPYIDFSEANRQQMLQMSIQPGIGIHVTSKAALRIQLSMCVCKQHGSLDGIILKNETCLQ